MLVGRTMSFQKFPLKQNIFLETSKTKRTSFPLDQNKRLPPTASLKATAGEAEPGAMRLAWARRAPGTSRLVPVPQPLPASCIAQVPEDTKVVRCLVALQCCRRKSSAPFHSLALPLAASPATPGRQPSGPRHGAARTDPRHQRLRSLCIKQSFRAAKSMNTPPKREA